MIGLLFALAFWLVIGLAALGALLLFTCAAFSVSDWLDTQSRREAQRHLPDLAPMSKTDRAVQSTLWPHVIPLREVAGTSTKRARR